MPCNQPMPAWKNTQTGIVTFGNERPRGADRDLALPCGKCLGCQQSHAMGWTLRCIMEYQQHDSATFTTLTYNDDHLPNTLSKRHLQLYYKRLRKSTGRTFRHFTAGEYGDTYKRPHYHAILFGLHARTDKDQIDMAWGLGNVYTVPVTPAAIAYTAGYTAKKLGWLEGEPHERINYETGEVYIWQPPFLQMSRGGRTGNGIGGTARGHAASWRDYAILNGRKIPVPQYLHQAWKDTASEEEIELKEHEKLLNSLTKERMTTERLNAQEQILKAENALRAERRKH